MNPQTDRIEMILTVTKVRGQERVLSDDGKIVVTQRGHDYKAHLAGQPGKWDCGPTPGKAIANLKLTWPEG